MKIVLATPLYPPELGGPATYAEALVSGLPALGIDVELVKFSDVRHLPKLFRHVAYYRRVVRAAKSADLILALDPVSVGLPAAQAAKKTRKPFVVKIVGDYAWEQGTQRFKITSMLDEFVKEKRVPAAVASMRAVQNSVANAATRIIVPSNYLKGIIEMWDSRIAPEKISIIYNSIELPENLQPLPTNESEILTVGRLVPWKHIDAVIDAVIEVRKKFPNAVLTIVGDGPDRAKLQEKAQELGDVVKFTGALSHDDTFRAIQSCGVFVLNSSYEGLSHVLVEASMLGSAIIATDVGGNPEVVTNGENGVLIPSGDTAALVEALERLLGSWDLKVKLRAHAKESSARFSRPEMLSQTAALLKSVAGLS